MAGIPLYKVKYNSSDGMSNEIITNTISTTLTDLEPNTTYSLVVEGLTPDNNTVTTSQPETFTTSKIDRVNLAFKLMLKFADIRVFVLRFTFDQNCFVDKM